MRTREELCEFLQQREDAHYFLSFLEGTVYEFIVAIEQEFDSIQHTIMGKDGGTLEHVDLRERIAQILDFASQGMMYRVLRGDGHSSLPTFSTRQEAWDSTSNLSSYRFLPVINEQLEEYRKTFCLSASLYSDSSLLIEEPYRTYVREDRTILQEYIERFRKELWYGYSQIHCSQDCTFCNNNVYVTLRKKEDYILCMLEDDVCGITLNMETMEVQVIFGTIDALSFLFYRMFEIF